MNTILIPTDFSETAENATHYAAEIAKTAQARMILFHAYSIPFVSPEAPAMISNIKAIEERCIEELKKLRAHIHLQHGPHIHIDIEYRCGFAVEEIEHYLKTQPVDLIVMGMRGDNFLAEKLIGSVTTSVMQRIGTPVLIVNKNIQFNGIKKITFAYDHTSIESKAVLDPLKEMSSLFKTHVYILKVCREGESDKLPNVTEAVAGVRMDHLLEGTRHSFHVTEDNNVVEGINRFIEEKNTDMVVMIPHKESFFHKLFNGSDTQHMAFHLKVPLLTLPE